MSIKMNTSEIRTVAGHAQMMATGNASFARGWTSAEISETELAECRGHSVGARTTGGVGWSTALKGAVRIYDALFIEVVEVETLPGDDFRKN